MSFFKSVDLIPTEILYRLVEEYKADTNPNKITFLRGAYKTEKGESYVLPVVRVVEKAMVNDETLNHEYLPIQGMESLSTAACRLALGPECKALAENRVAYVQSLSGTGAVRLALQFLSNFHSVKTVYVSKPTWGNHKKIALHAGYTDIREYTYYNPETKGLDIGAMIKDLEAVPEQSIVILHGCAHNPCGVDPSKDEWKMICDVVEKKNLVCIIDFAYQGFVSGDPDVDAWSLRCFVERGIELFFCQSFAKIFGLYNERVGNLGVVCKDSQLAVHVKSQLKAIIRPMYSNPPNHGARIVSTILNDKALEAAWRDELKNMCARITRARQLLYSKLKDKEVSGGWSHILSQNGMFTFSGLNEKQVSIMKEKHHIYMLPNGRINMCAVTDGNVDRIVDGFKDVVVNQD